MGRPRCIWIVLPIYCLQLTLYSILSIRCRRIQRGARKIGYLLTCCAKGETTDQWAILMRSLLLVPLYNYICFHSGLMATPLVLLWEWGQLMTVSLTPLRLLPYIPWMEWVKMTKLCFQLVKILRLLPLHWTLRTTTYLNGRNGMSM